MNRRDRVEVLTEKDSFDEWDPGLAAIDILNFQGADETNTYKDKLVANREKTGEMEAFTGGSAYIGSHQVGFGVMDFRFLGASMGSVVGEKVTRLFERSTEERLPAVICCASGGARMQEGVFSLMQMAKTSGAVSRHNAAGLPYISILTHPTTGGVMASFATLSDVILAEPDALIGFAGPRVMKETTQSELPPGFQRSEFLLQRGLIDQVVHRGDLKDRLVHILDYMNVAA